MNKKNFANGIIVVCLSVALIITGVTVYEYHRLNEVMPSGVLTALLGMWGGELLIIAIRQIFGSDVFTKKNEGGKKP